MKDGFKMFGVILLVLIGATILALLIRGAGLGSNAFFAPKEAEVRNQVFHNTQAYTDGMATDLGDLKLQYEMATDQGRKDAIAAVIRQRFASYDKSKLPSDLRDFYYSL